MDLLERSLFLQQLDHLLQSAAAGRGQLAFVAGEAGIGKSVLVETLCQAAGTSVRTLRGSCDPLSTPRPLGPLIDIADQVGGDLALLLRDAGQRHNVFSTFLNLLADNAKPSLIIIEDAHWADEATLDLLRFVGRRIENVPTLMIVTYRNDEVGPRHPLRTVLGDLATSSVIQRMEIPPLSLEAVQTLTQDSGVDARHLHGLTGGNPFFVTEVLASGASGVPPTVRDAVLARAARLSDAARSVLDVAAIIGFSSEAWLLAETSEVAGGAVEECVAMGVLRHNADGTGFTFRHEIGRESILSAIYPSQRAHLHQRVLVCLENSTLGSDQMARLAHHAEESGDGERVLRYAPVAAQHATALSAHREAMRQYARALRFADRLSVTEKAELLQTYARACYQVDHLDESINAWQLTASIWHEAGLQLREGNALAELSQVLVAAGRNAESEEAIRAGMQLLESLPAGDELVRSYGAFARLRMLNRDNDDAIAWGRKTIELGEQLGNTRAIINAYNTVGSAMLVAGDNEGFAYLERSLELSRESEDDVGIAGAYGNMGTGAGETYQFQIADRYLNACIAFSSERDFDYNRYYCLSWLALSHLFQGRWSEAADVASSLVRRPNVAAISRIMALAALGRIRARRGDPDVWDALDEALELADQTATLQRIGPVRAARAEAAWLAGDSAKVVEEARAVLDLALKHRHRWHVGELSYWLWKCGQEVDLPDYVAEPYRLQMTGQWQAAADAWLELGCPYESVRALAESDDDAALKRALQEFERLGATPLVTVVSRALRERGARGIPRGPRRETLENPAGLTRREMEVLQLVAEGLRNAEIAERLYLSPKTVDHHVSAMLAKLDVHSRTEAVHTAMRLGILS